MIFEKLDEEVYLIKDAFSSSQFTTLYDELLPGVNSWDSRSEQNIHSRWFGLHKPKPTSIHEYPSFLLVAPAIKFYIKKIIKPTFDIFLYRINTNIQYFANEGDFHRDAPVLFDGSWGWGWTFLTFTQMEWNSSWGGEFIVKNKQGKYIHVPYIPSQSVLFNGELEHRGSSPNIYSTFARTTIAWSFGNIENKGAF